MKTFTRILAAVFLAAAALISCSDKLVPADQLPAAAHSFIQQYFPGIPISYVKKDAGLKTGFEVVLTDGTEIDFDGKGEWDSVDCKRSAVPSALVPAAIAGYVQTNFPGQMIVKIDKELYGYEIELGSGLDLKFDSSGKLIRIDD